MGRVNTSCLSCGNPDLIPFLDLGRLPLANSLPTVDELGCPDELYPLEVALCPDCSLVQLTQTVPPDALFRDYLYFSSFSDDLVNHARALVDRTVDERELAGDSLAIEIASNDGYLLQHYRNRSVPVLGIEPARNVAEVARSQRGIETISEFFSAQVARQLADQGRYADVIHANNVLAHVPDIHGFINGIATLLKPHGVAFVEVPYIKDMLDRCEFDTIYHEHLCYFSLTALDELFQRHGLIIRDVERLEIHGGSIRLHVIHAGFGVESAAVCDLLAEEAQWSVRSPRPYRVFAAQVREVRNRLVSALRQLTDSGRRVAAYGAAAKATILLNYCGIGTETLAFVADRSTYKQGRYVPGVRIPIVPPETLTDWQPDYCLILAWNFADEIMRQQSAFAEAGGRFLTPLDTAVDSVRRIAA